MDGNDLPPIRARSDDPDTSHIAASRVGEFASDHFTKILEAMKRYGPGTQFGIAARCKLTPTQVHKRLPELQNKHGLVIPTGATMPGPSGRPCRIWRLTTQKERDEFIKR